jgi:hypothetical protein
VHTTLIASPAAIFHSRRMAGELDTSHVKLLELQDEQAGPVAGICRFHAPLRPAGARAYLH